MKIAHVAPPWIPVPPPAYGGTESILYHLVEDQVALGHDVTLFAPGDAQTSARHVSFFPRSLAEEGVPWHAHMKEYFHLFCAFEQANEFDIVHSHLSSSGDLYIFPLSSTLTVPHVTTLHGTFPFDRVYDRFPTWVGEGDRYFIQRWGRNVPIIAISEQARKDVPYDLHFAGVVHHGLPTQEYPLSTMPREDYVVWLGRFVPEKGAHLAIHAALEAHVPIILAGIYDPQSEEARQHFHNDVEPLIDGERVKYIGPVNREQKVWLLSRARGLLNPIRWAEPFGLVMLEAMAVGCPVIAFDSGSALELIVDGQTGFLVHDLDAMIETIPRLEEIDGVQARRHVETFFSIRAMTKKYLAIYQQLIQDWSATA